MSFPKLEALASTSRLSAILTSFALVAAGAVAPSAYGQCKNDCGIGDFSEGEACLVDEDVDVTNGGCNLAVPIFIDAAPGRWCGTTSTYDVAGVDTRDTDWYLIDQADLIAADVDGNGVVLIRSTVTSEGPQATFIVTIGTDCDAVSVVSVGWSDPGCMTGGSAEYAVILADHPDGVVAFTSTADMNGIAIQDGVECALGANDYILEIELIELDEACAPGSGSCSVAFNGSPGCEDPECCQAVCDLDSNCCIGEWDDLCVDLALAEGCAAITCDPEGETIGDNIGGSAANLTGGGFATQIFPDFPAFSIVAIDDVTVTGGSITATCVDMVGFRFNCVDQPNCGDPLDWVNDVTEWRVDIYSSPEVAGMSLVGDVASVVVLPPAVEVFGAQEILRIDLTAAPGPSIVLPPGTYWIGVLPDMDFGLFAQIAVGETTLGNNNAWQANPGGGFDEFGDDFINPLNTNLAYRLVGDPAKGGGETVFPSDYSIFRGLLTGGKLGNVVDSDDIDLCHAEFITIFPAEAPITLDFDGSFANDSPATLDVTFESSANTPSLEITISFWNYNTASWDIVGSTAHSFNADAVNTFRGTPADHVESGTGNVRTRYEVRKIGPVLTFPFVDCIDQFFWTTTD